MTIFNNIVLATADTLPVIATTPIFRLANQYLNNGFNNNNLSKNIIMMFRDNLGRVLALANMQGGRGNPIAGQKRPKLSRLFLCLSKIKSNTVLLFNSDMVALVGSLKRLAVPVIGISTPANAAAYDVEIKSSGLYPQITGHTAMNTSTDEIRLNKSQTQTEFKDAAIALCGGNAFLFLPNPSQATLSIIIAKCERLLIAAKSLQTEGGVA